MAEHPDHKYINKLLDDLESGDLPRRVMAVRALAKLRARNQLITRILKRVVSRDPDWIVRLEAAAALIRRGLQTRAGKFIEFAIGFVGWFIVNGAIWAGIATGDFGAQRSLFLLFPNIFILPANLLALIILAFVRSSVALGLLTAYTVNFLLALIMGLLLYGVCWIPFYIR